MEAKQRTGIAQKSKFGTPENVSFVQQFKFVGGKHKKEREREKRVSTCNLSLQDITFTPMCPQHRILSGAAHLFFARWRGGLGLRSLWYTADGGHNLGDRTQSAVSQRAFFPRLGLRCRVHCEDEQREQELIWRCGFAECGLKSI